jgi:DNA-binding CsgD family transcriptional regulator/ligand-binding sensor protein
MERNITFLQDVQDAYAHMADLSMFITDERGNTITRISDLCPFTKLAYEEWGNRGMLYEYLMPLKSTKQPLILDTSIGLKLIISPIRIKEQLTYYLFAGLILEPSSREYVYEHIRSKAEYSKALLKAFELMEERPEDKKKESIKTIRKLTKVIEEYLSLKEDKKLVNNTSISFYQSLESIRTGLATNSTILTEFKNRNSKIDFVGLALENKNEQYVIDTIQGDDTENFIGHTFLMGEGFLGHTIVFRQFQFWKNASNDPRCSFFTQKGLQVKSFFCAPIFSNSLVKGVLFGGSTKSELEEPDIYLQVKAYSSSLSMLLTTQSLKENLQNHLLELSTFNEIFRVITSMEDLKKVLYILVDISINMVRGPFACIVFKPTAKHSKVEMVSRGLSSTEIKEYGYHVAVHAFSGKTKNTDYKQPTQRETSWGTDVLEFPLLFNHQLYGMLCIGVPQQDDPEKYKSFLSSLAVAGGISIHLRESGKDQGTDDCTIELLHKVMGQYDSVKSNLALKVRDLVEGFATYLNESDLKILKQASLLIIYDFPFIKEYIKGIELRSILEGCYVVLQGKKIDRKESELISLIYQYYNQNENLDSINGLTNISEELRHQFVSFIKKQTIIESEISLVNFPLIDEEQQKTGLSNLYKELNLSSRELEVLNLVLKGYSNNEIASTLFISDHTVKNHMTKILHKLGVSDRSQAIAKVYQMGYIPPS